jgi:YD repeat-containing protein
MSALTIAFLLASTVLAAAQQTTFRDASGRITGYVSPDSNGTRTFRDGSGRITGTASTDSNGTTTFRDGSGRIIEHGFRVCNRTTDRGQNFPSRHLPFQRVGEFPRARLHLVKQSHVFDRDHPPGRRTW